MLTQERLKELLHYDPETGLFTWRVSRRGHVRTGNIAGCKSGPNGYRVLKVDGVVYLEHRLAWFYMTGEFPASDIDHFDGDKVNNRFGNLRLVSRKQNLENQKLHRDNGTGYRGVTLDKRTGRYVARIIHYGRGFHIGVYDTALEAAAAAKAARDSLFTHHHTPHAA